VVDPRRVRTQAVRQAVGAGPNAWPRFRVESVFAVRAPAGRPRLPRPAWWKPRPIFSGGFSVTEADINPALTSTGMRPTPPARAGTVLHALPVGLRPSTAAKGIRRTPGAMVARQFGVDMNVVNRGRQTVAKKPDAWWSSACHINVEAMGGQPHMFAGPLGPDRRTKPISAPPVVEMGAAGLDHDLQPISGRTVSWHASGFCGRRGKHITMDLCTAVVGGMHCGCRAKSRLYTAPCWTGGFRRARELMFRSHWRANETRCSADRLARHDRRNIVRHSRAEEIF